MTLSSESSELAASLRWADIGVHVVSVKHLQVRKDSAIDAVTVAGATSSRDVIVKQHRVISRDGRPPSELARHEFEILAMLGRELAVASAGGTTYAVPAPLLVDEASSTIAMERASGEPLDRIISAARRRGAIWRLLEPLRQAGSWLRTMQRCTRAADDARPRLDAILRAAAEDVGRIAREDAAVGGKRERLLMRLQDLHAAIREREIPVVGYHGDFWPGNVFLSKGRVEVIDFEGFGRGLPLQDAVYLAAYLERLPLGAVDSGLLRRAFLEGYSPGETIAPAEWEFFRLVDVIRAQARNDRVVPGGLKRWISRTPRSIILAAAR